MVTPARPLIFTGESVRATLTGRKTQTRRLVMPMPGLQRRWLTLAGITGSPRLEMCNLRPQDGTHVGARMEHPMGGPLGWVRCPYAPGLYWVKESFAVLTGNGVRTVYRADGTPKEAIDGGEVKGMRWTSPLFMQREQSRLTIEVTGVRVERVQSITETDAIAEGMAPYDLGCWSREQTLTSGERIVDSPCRASYAVAWDEINDGRATWKSNPWVWVLTFGVVAQQVQR